MSSTELKKIPIHHARKLNSLFGDALESDFNYFTEDYRKAIYQSNSTRSLALAILRPSRLILGLYDSSGLQGYSISSIQPNGKAFLFWLYIAPNLRGLGLGKELLRRTEREFKSKLVSDIELITHNQHHFYETQDYEIKKIMREIAAGVDMYVMTKALV